MKKHILITLLMLIISFSSTGQELPTIGEVFDFQIGDEFHYDNGYNWVYGLLISHEKIINVGYSNDSNEVTYTIIKEDYHTWDWDWNWNDSLLDPPYNVDTLTAEYTNLDSSMIFYDDLFLQDTVHYFDENFCSAEIYGAHYYGDGPEGQITRIREWGIGLGWIRDYSASWTGSSSTNLYYYLKDGVECTLQEVNVGIDSPLDLPSITIFPTLFTNFVSIEGDYKEEFNFRLYSISGQLVLQETINSTSVQLNLGFLKAGTYVYVIQSRINEQNIKSGKIIKGK